MSELISIVIPVFEAEQTIERCIVSLINQSYEQLEIILVDDGSTDQSGFLCDLYAEKDNRIKVIHQQNTGVSAARNAGIRAANGDYIGFVDSDDWCERDMYRHLYQLSDKEKADIAICGFVFDKSDGRCFTESSTQIDRSLVLTREQALQSIAGSKKFEKASYNVWNKLFSRQLINDNSLLFNNDLIYGEDACFLTAAILAAEKIVFQPKPVYHYCQKIKSLENQSNTGQHFSRIKMGQLIALNTIITAVENDYPTALSAIKGSVCAAALILLRDFFSCQSEDIVIYRILVRTIRRNLWALMRSHVRNYKVQTAALAASLSPQVFRWLCQAVDGMRP
ncbi:MAG: glycosyltransferase [Sporolactobacillus sp.]